MKRSAGYRMEKFDRESCSWLAASDVYSSFPLAEGLV